MVWKCVSTQVLIIVSHGTTSLQNKSAVPACGQGAGRGCDWPARAQANQGLLRAMDCFHEAILMVDATEGWRVMHMNQAAVQQTGADSAPDSRAPQGSS